MICGLEFECIGEETVESVLNCGLSFDEISTKRSKFFKASFGGTKRNTQEPVFIVEVFPESQRVKVKGNLHYYFNQGKHNANDFDFLSVVRCVNEICLILKISPKKAFLRGFEFGINLLFIFLFNRLLTLKTAIAEKDKKAFFEFYSFIFTQYVLKMYDKGRMFDLTDPLTRIELHIDKMQWIQKQIPSLKTLSDLQNIDTMYALNEIFYKILDDIIIIEDMNTSLMNPKELSMWYYLTDLRSWQNITPDKRRKQKKTFDYLTKKYQTTNYKNTLLELVRNKSNDLFKAKATILPSENKNSKIEIDHDFSKWGNNYKATILPSGNEKQKNEIEHDFTEWKSRPQTTILPLMLNGKIMTKEQEKPIKLLEGSFTGKTGKFYIQNPTEKNRFAVYDSAYCYDKRLSLPSYLNREEAEKDFSYFLPIDLNTLTTIKVQDGISKA